jgi:hypothetical protein
MYFQISMIIANIFLFAVCNVQSATLTQVQENINKPNVTIPVSLPSQNKITSTKTKSTPKMTVSTTVKQTTTKTTKRTITTTSTKASTTKISTKTQTTFIVPKISQPTTMMKNIPTTSTTKISTKTQTIVIAQKISQTTTIIKSDSTTSTKNDMTKMTEPQTTASKTLTSLPISPNNSNNQEILTNLTEKLTQDIPSYLTELVPKISQTTTIMKNDATTSIKNNMIIMTEPQDADPKTLTSVPISPNNSNNFEILPNLTETLTKDISSYLTTLVPKISQTTTIMTNDSTTSTENNMIIITEPQTTASKTLTSLPISPNNSNNLETLTNLTGTLTQDIPSNLTALNPLEEETSQYIFLELVTLPSQDGKIQTTFQKPETLPQTQNESSNFSSPASLLPLKTDATTILPEYITPHGQDNLSYSIKPVMVLLEDLINKFKMTSKTSSTYVANDASNSTISTISTQAPTISTKTSVIQTTTRQKQILSFINDFFNKFG